MAGIRNVVYKDIDILFDKHPVTRKLNTLTNNDAIARSIKNLILTNKGERPYQPFIGGDIRNKLFEPNDGTVDAEVRGSIEEVLNNYEPRAEILNVSTRQGVDKMELRNSAAFFGDEHSLYVEITFRAINQERPQTISFFLERIR